MYPYNLQQVFQIDASNNTHPMTNYVESQIDIYRLFDKITYDKCKKNLQIIILWIKIK